MIVENWKTIKNYENYQISDFGNVKMTENNLTRKERQLKPLITTKGYHRVRLYQNNISKFYFIHRLVAEYFLTNIENKNTVNHINGNKSDNSLINLEWNTYRENMNHSIENKLSSCGERNGRSKITQIQAEEIRKSTLTSNQLSEIYGIHKSNINRIRRGDGWK